MLKFHRFKKVQSLEKIMDMKKRKRKTKREKEKGKEEKETVRKKRKKKRKTGSGKVLERSQNQWGEKQVWPDP